MTEGLDLETRRRRLRYRAARTGTKETDLLVGDVIARLGHRLPPEEVAQAERLLTENDVDITNWISGRIAGACRARTLRSSLASAVRP